MGKNKKNIIVSTTIIFIVMLIIFLLYMAKKNNFGNNITSQEMVNKIVEVKSYQAKVEVEIISNKNTNKYIITQKYEEPNYLKQQVIEPNNISGVTIINNDGNVIIENTELNLKNIYENYQGLLGNELDLISFIQEYKNNKSAKYSERANEITMETKNKNLYIDKKTGKPSKMEVRYANKNLAVYILYREVNVNS